MLTRIRQWYSGTTIYHEGHTDGHCVVMPHWSTHYSRSALIARRAVKFWLDHWKFLITTTVAIVAILVTYLVAAK